MAGEIDVLSCSLPILNIRTNLYTVFKFWKRVSNALLVVLSAQVNLTLPQQQCCSLLLRALASPGRLTAVYLCAGHADRC